MNRHPVTLENLIDWLDGRLERELVGEVEAHLQTGCAACQGDLAWLRRFKEVARVEVVEPPAELVAQVRARYRPRPALRLRLPRLAWPAAMPRLALAVAALALVAVCLSQAPVVVAGDATLTAVDSAAEVVSGAGDAWRAVGPGESLRAGDSVRVSGGAAVLTLFDGSTLALEPGTELELRSLRSGLVSGVREIALYQATGTVRYDVPPLRGALSAFHVQSPTALVTVRGTSFVVEVESPPSTVVAVLEGAVTVAGPVDRAVLRAHEAAVVHEKTKVRPLPGYTPRATRPAKPERATRTPKDPPGRQDQPTPEATRTKAHGPDEPPGAGRRPDQRARPRGANKRRLTPGPTETPTAAEPSCCKDKPRGPKESEKALGPQPVRYREAG